MSTRSRSTSSTATASKDNNNNSRVEDDFANDYHELVDETSPMRQSFAKQAAAVIEMAPMNTPSINSLFSATSTNNNNIGSTINGCNSNVSAAVAVLPPAPLVKTSMHLLNPNGSISGRDVASIVLPEFPDLLSAIPLNSHRNALACIDGRATISHNRIHKFLTEIGYVLHEHVRIGRGHRIAVVLPNGPELALAILAVTCWASCVPLNAFAASAELQSDVEKCGADCIIGLDPVRTGSGNEIQQLASLLHIPFCGLVPDSDDAGLFELVPPVQLPRSVDVLFDRNNGVLSRSTSQRLRGDDKSEKSTKSRQSTKSSKSKSSTKTSEETNRSSSGKSSPSSTSSITRNIKEHSKISTEIDGDVVQNGEVCEPITPDVLNPKEDDHPPVDSDHSCQLTVAEDANMPMSTAIQDNIEDIALVTEDGEENEADVIVKSNNSGREMLQIPNQHDDEVLVLFTSGTTGGKKLVPHLLADVLVATACISVSWKLTPSDTNCNLMPLFHVGGIIRQVFSPILSGGCVICCPSFDPITFWQLMNCNNKETNKPSFTWYYAAPTMHQLILQTGRAEGYIPDYRNRDENGNPINSLSVHSPSSSQHKKPRLRMIANAAGGLLPSLARELRQAFGANVLPSYGMTECMPITSPPASYELEKPGTSGVAVGPELAILNLDTLEQLQTGKEGPICVRYEPCFRGYGMLVGDNGGGHDDGEKPPVTFLHTASGENSGWFDTGDLGYMDSDGYLYITGRSKEVINRGGEIISPMEVEEAIVAHPDVDACVAFSTAHSVLQEVVGLVLVMTPGRPRLDLPTLHEYLGQGRLAAPKWPQCLVHMDGGLPKSFTNKLLRVKLGKRLSLPELNDNMYPIERTFQATCPPQGTAVSVAIPCGHVSVNAAQVQQTLREELITDPDIQELIVVCHPSRIGALVVYVFNINRFQVIQIARAKIDAYSVPTHVCSLNGTLDDKELSEEFLPPPQPSDAIGSILQEENSRGAGPTDPLVTEIQEMMQMMLDLDCLPAPATSFFNLGGSSMLASQLASKVRKLYKIPFGGAEVFHHSTCDAIASVIHERQLGDGGSASRNGDSQSGSAHPASLAASSLFSKKLDLSKTPFEHSRMEVQPGYFTILFQLFPLFLIYPSWALTRIFLFFETLITVLNRTPESSAIIKFIMTLVLFHLAWVTLTPLVFVLCKWLIIGKYKHGRYPIWGSYYLRWWIVDILRKLVSRLQSSK
jgi:acyl-CoA synthetase (AMP-forming)/AMP-acid ligase II